MNVIIQSYRGVYSVCCPLCSCPVRAVVNKLTPIAAMGWHIELLGLRWVGSPRPQRYNNKLSTLKFSKLVSIYFLKDKKNSFLPGNIFWSKVPPSTCNSLSVGSGEGRAFPFYNKGGEKRYSAVERGLASYQCGPGSNPGIDAICASSLLLVFSLAPRGFSPGTPILPSA